MLGGGSWATALVKLLLNNLSHINWYIRSESTIDHIRKYGHNPNYITDIQFETQKITFYNSIADAIEQSDILIFAIPAPFLKESLENYHKGFAKKYIVSAIKGIVPQENLTIAEFFNRYYQVMFRNILIISGPCHAEEIALERLSYLTIASSSESWAEHLAAMLRCHYVKVKTSKDIYGTEYAAVLKNIFAIAAGIAHGLGYGDNFQAVLISNAMQEIKRFLEKTYKSKRKVLTSPYLGDLLVTAYSQFSRNRNFGMMIGKGYSVKNALMEMTMVAEGYYASKGIHKLRTEMKLTIPIAETVYRILYENATPSKEIHNLTKILK